MKFYYPILSLLLIACNSNAGTQENLKNTPIEVEQATSNVDENISTLEKSSEETNIQADSLTVPSFTIKFNFAEQVKKILDSAEEGLTINIMLSGEPANKSKIEGKNYYNEEEEMIYLKNLDISYKNNENQTLTIENLKISKEALDALENPNYMVTINMFSSRKSSDNNIFTTNTYIMDKINVIKAKTHTMDIKML